MLKEFKEFALKGNVIDLAVGVAIGAAFGAIVTALVNDLINPIVGLLLGGTDLNNLFWVLKEGATPGPYASLDAARQAGAAALAYGALLNAIINFLSVAIVLFLIVKMANKFRRKEESTTRSCPYCMTEVAKSAKRCPACTSEIEPV